MDQDRLALFGPAALKHIVPHRKQRFGERRSLGHGQAFGHRQAVIRHREAIFSVATARNQSADLSAQLVPADTDAKGDNLTRNLESRDR